MANAYKPGSAIEIHACSGGYGQWTPRTACAASRA